MAIELYPILTVQDAFKVSNIGLVLLPDLPFPSRAFRPRAASVMVDLADGSTLVVETRLEMQHFRPGGFKLMLVLPAELKGRVVPGCRVWVDASLREELAVDAAPAAEEIDRLEK